MQFSIILDTYTLDLLPELLETQNSNNVQDRVYLNIKNFTDSINAKDYRYAYNKLSPGFKSNNFPTLQSFENYIISTWYSRNNIKHVNYSEEGGLHLYDIKFENAENGLETVTRTIIMQIQEGTDFVLSFNI